MSGRRIADLATHDEAFISVQQFADYLGVHEKTVRNKWINAGDLPAYDFEGLWRIDRIDALQFVARQIPAAREAGDHGDVMTAAGLPTHLGPPAASIPFHTWPTGLARILLRADITRWDQLLGLSEARLLMLTGFSLRYLRVIAELADAAGHEHRWHPRPAPQQDPRVRIRHPGVYFIQTEGFIKIGISHDVPLRFSRLITASPYELVRLGFIPESNKQTRRRLERELHCEFEAFQYRGEWFYEHLALVQFIGQHTRPWPDTLR